MTFTRDLFGVLAVLFAVGFLATDNGDFCAWMVVFAFFSWQFDRHVDYPELPTLEVEQPTKEVGS